MSEKLIDRLTKSRKGRALLEEIEESEQSEAAWKSAAEALRELRRTMPDRIGELQSAVDTANDEAARARKALDVAREKSGAAFRLLESEIFRMNQDQMRLEGILYEKAPDELRRQLDDLREQLLNNYDKRISTPTSSVDLRRRRIVHDRTAIIAHLAERKRIEEAIQAVEARILDGLT